MVPEIETADAVEAPPADNPERIREPDGRFATAKSGHQAAFDAAHNKFFEALEKGKSHGEGMVPAQLTKKDEQPEAETLAGKPDGVTGKADSQAVQAGLSALKRLKVPAKVIDGMTQAELAEYGKEAARQTAATDELFREVGELRKQAGKSKAKDSESAKAEQPEIDLEADLKLLASTLDDDAGKAVGGLIKKIDARSRAEVAELREKLEALYGERQFDSLSETLADEAKAGLVERFPQLSDRKFIRNTILPLMGKLNSDGQYTDANGVVDHSQLLLHAAKVACDEKPQSQAPQSRSKAANPITDTSSSHRSRPKTLSDKMDLAYELAVKKDMPLDQIRAALR